MEVMTDDKLKKNTKKTTNIQHILEFLNVATGKIYGLIPWKKIY